MVFYFKKRGGSEALSKKKDKLLKMAKSVTKEDQKIGECKGGVTSV